MATLTVTTSAQSALQYWGASDESYDTVHDAAEATQVLRTSGAAGLGQLYLPSTTRHRIFRWGLQFDCSALPANSYIPAAKIQIYAHSDNSTVDFDVTIVNGDDLDFPGVVADYGQLLDEVTSYGTWNTSNWPASASYVDIDLNETGIAEITVGLATAGIVKFGLRSSEDIDVSAPTGLEYGFFGLATNPPKLILTYGGESTGVIAVVEERLHYVDAYGAERYIEGTIV